MELADRIKKALGTHQEKRATVRWVKHKKPVDVKKIMAQDTEAAASSGCSRKKKQSQDTDEDDYQQGDVLEALEE